MIMVFVWLLVVWWRQVGGGVGPLRHPAGPAYCHPRVAVPRCPPERHLSGLPRDLEYAAPAFSPMLRHVLRHVL
jgi:hypothetical protein